MYATLHCTMHLLAGFGLVVKEQQAVEMYIFFHSYMHVL